MWASLQRPELDGSCKSYGEAGGQVSGGLKTLFSCTPPSHNTEYPFTFTELKARNAVRQRKEY